MDRPRIYVDFNELLEPDLVLLSKTDVRAELVWGGGCLVEGLRVYVYEDDTDEHGRPDNVNRGWSRREEYDNHMGECREVVLAGSMFAVSGTSLNER